MQPVHQILPERRRTTDNRFTSCHIDNLGNLHIINQLQPSMRRTIRPYSQPSQTHHRTNTRVKTVRFSLESYSNASTASNSRPLPSFLEIVNNDPKPLPQIPPPAPFKIQRKPVPPPKDHFAQVLECKRVSIQRLKTPKPRRLSLCGMEEDVVALVKVYRPPRRIRVHWLKVLKGHRKLAFPIVLILVPTRKMPRRVSKVLVVGQGRRPGTYEDPQVEFGEGKRVMMEADMKYSRRPKSSPESRKTNLVVPEEPRRVSTPDLWHPGTKWMD